MIKFASDGIIGFSTKPLRLVMVIGLLSVFVSLLVLSYSIVVWLIGENIQPGWTSIMVAITFFSGIQLLGLGLVGQYIARIYDESKIDLFTLYVKLLTFLRLQQILKTCVKKYIAKNKEENNCFLPCFILLKL